MSAAGNSAGCYDQATRVNSAALAADCQAFARLVPGGASAVGDGEERLLTGALMIRAKNGTAVPNPLVGVGNKAMADVVRYARNSG